MTTYSLGDRVLVRVGRGTEVEGEVIDVRGGRVRVIYIGDDGSPVFGVVKSLNARDVRPLPPPRVAPIIPPPTPREEAMAGAYEARYPEVYASRAVPKPPRRWDCAEYRAHVRAWGVCACCNTRAPEDDPIEASHHGKRAMSRKSDDTRCIPLLRSHHRYYHDHGTFPGMTREETDRRAAAWAASVLPAWCAEHGVIDTDNVIIEALTRALRERED